MNKWDYLVEGDADLRMVERAWQSEPSEDTLILYLNTAARYHRKPTIELTKLTSQMVRTKDVRELLAVLKPESFTFEGKTMANVDKWVEKHVRANDARVDTNHHKVACWFVAYTTSRYAFPFSVLASGGLPYDGGEDIGMFYHVNMSTVNTTSSSVKESLSTFFEMISGSTLLLLDNHKFRDHGVPIYWQREAPSLGAVNGWIKAGK